MEDQSNIHESVPNFPTLPLNVQSSLLMIHMRNFRDLFFETCNKWVEDKAQRLGAALAYYAAFSIAPLLVLLVAVVGFFYQDDSLLRIQSQIAMMTGNDAAEAIAAMIRGIKNTGGSVTPTIFTLITLLIGATGMFGQLQDAMNTIWEVTSDPRRFWAELLRTRLLSFSMVLAICFLLLAGMALTAYLSTVSKYFQEMLPFTARALPFLDFAVSFGVTTMLFAATFKILPDVHISWGDVWPGAATTAALFAIGKIGIGMYLGHSSFASAYGAAGSLLAVLAWIYYSSQILFFGAEFTCVYTKSYRHRLLPARGAVLMSEEMRIHQGIPHTETVEEAFKKRGVA